MKRNRHHAIRPTPKQPRKQAPAKRNRRHAIRPTLKRLPAERIATILDYQLTHELSHAMREHAKHCQDCRSRIVKALSELAREIQNAR